MGEARACAAPGAQSPQPVAPLVSTADWQSQGAPGLQQHSETETACPQPRQSMVVPSGSPGPRQPEAYLSGQPALMEPGRWLLQEDGRVLGEG